MGCYIWYSEEGPGRNRSPPRPLLALPNVMVYTNQRPVYVLTVFLYNGLLLCGFNLPIKGLSKSKVTV